MNQRSIVFGAAIAVMALTIAQPALADASSAGNAAAQTLVGVITGNIGLLIGLGVTIMGLWTWIVGQKTAAGVTMIVGGVLLTMAPGLFKGARDMAYGVVDQFGGGDVYNVDSGGGSSR